MTFCRSQTCLLTVLLVSASRAGAVFSDAEYERRLSQTQSAMQQEGLGALFLTMEVHHSYFGGVASEFWASPTRPFFLVLPSKGNITAVVPSIGENLYSMSATTIQNIETWSAPNPTDDGVSKLAAVLKKTLDAAGVEKVGAELGFEMQMRMPVQDFLRLQQELSERASIVDATPLLKKLRSVKSEEEIALQRIVCQAQSRATDRLSHVIKPGMTEKEWCRAARIELMRAGVDRVQYMACRSGAGGYDDIIGASTNRKLQPGDMIVIDMGSTIDGYWCDFNRNYYVGTELPQEIVDLHASLYHAVEAGIAEAQPGKTTADVFNAMLKQLPDTIGSASSVGRFGHGVGLAITEFPSLLPLEANQTVILEEGMILALEPSAGFSEGRMLVHEENVVVRKGGGELLSVRGPLELPLIDPGTLPRDCPLPGACTAVA